MAVVPLLRTATVSGSEVVLSIDLPDDTSSVHKLEIKPSEGGGMAASRLDIGSMSAVRILRVDRDPEDDGVESR